MVMVRTNISKRGDVSGGLPVYTTGAIARLLHTSPRTVARWIDTGAMKGYCLPESADRRVPGEALRAFCQSRGIPVPPELRPPGCLTVGMPESEALSLRRLLSMPLTATADVAAAGWCLAREHVSAIVIDQAIGREAMAGLMALLAGEAYRADRTVIVLRTEDGGEESGWPQVPIVWHRRPVAMKDVAREVRG